MSCARCGLHWGWDDVKYWGEVEAAAAGKDGHGGKGHGEGGHRQGEGQQQTQQQQQQAEEFAAPAARNDDYETQQQRPS